MGHRLKPTGGKAARAFLRDRRGATLIEFAIIVAPFMALLVAILQISTTAIAQQALDTASDKAVRQLMTGQAQSAKMTKAQFKSLLCSNLPFILKCANVLIDVRVVANFSDADTGRLTPTFGSNGAMVDDTAYTPGSGGDIVVAKVVYVWNVQRGPLGFDISTMSNNRRLLTAVNVFKTEPFS